MKFWLNGRFWIAVLVIGGGISLALLDRVQGSEALAGVLGIATGWGLKKGEQK